MDTKLSIWLAIGEGMRVTWADYAGHYGHAVLFWSGELRGQRVVECTYKPQKALSYGKH